MSRFCGGCTHGLVYVTILIHASENASKEFREFLVLIIGATINYSIFFSVLCFFDPDGLLNSRYYCSSILIVFAICAAIVVVKHSTETVPFLLQHDGSEMDGLGTIAKLRKKPLAARSVHHEFLTLKKVINDEDVYYGKASFWSVWLNENRKSFVFCCYARLCSVLSFNLPLIVIILLFIRTWITSSLPCENGVCLNTAATIAPNSTNQSLPTFKPPNTGKKDDRTTKAKRAVTEPSPPDAEDVTSTTEPPSIISFEPPTVQPDPEGNVIKKPGGSRTVPPNTRTKNSTSTKSASTADGSGDTFFIHLIKCTQKKELMLLLLFWFLFGILTTSFLYTLNMKRFIYHVACVCCLALVVTGVAHSFQHMSSIMHITLIIYFNYVTIPIDLFGHGILAEAFPITLKAFSIAAVSILEHCVHIVVIGLYLTHWFRDSVVIFTLAVAFFAHQIAINLPQKSDLTLAEARDEYQKVNLWFVGQARPSDGRVQL